MNRLVLRAVLVAPFVALPMLGATTGMAGPSAGGVPPSQVPHQTPTVRVELPARILSWTRAARGLNTSYTGGAISYDIEVSAPTTKDLGTNVLVKNWKLGVDVKLPITLTAGGKSTVRFTEAAGIVDACVNFGYEVSLESDTTVTHRVVDITPNCTITPTAVDPTAPIPPDTLQSHRAGKVSYIGAKFALACVDKAGTKSLDAKVTASVVNKGSASTDVKLHFDGPKNASVKAIGALASNETKLVDVSWDHVVAGTYKLSVTATGAATYEPGWNVTVGLKCEPAATLK